MSRWGVAWFGCRRTHISALSLAHYFKYRPADSDLHLFVDHPRDGTHVPALLTCVEALRPHVSSIQVSIASLGLAGSIDAATSFMLGFSDYDYLVRLEDDMLAGPGSWDAIDSVFRLSDAWPKPLGLISGQSTNRTKGMSPIRIAKLGNFLIGINGGNTVEGLTALRVSMRGRGFTFPIEHARAYNVAWMNKCRKAGFEGGTILRPALAVQHIGYSTTVPRGTPIYPAKDWDTKKPIRLPCFDWNSFRRASIPAEVAYALRCVRELCVGLPEGVVEPLLELAGSEPPAAIPAVRQIRRSEAPARQVIPIQAVEKREVWTDL